MGWILWRCDFTVPSSGEDHASALKVDYQEESGETCINMDGLERNVEHGGCVNLQLKQNAGLLL